MSFVVGVAGLGACGGGRQHQALGTARFAAGGGDAIALPAQFANGEYRVRYQMWLPKAMEVAWTLRCGEHEETGVAGETFEVYQARRVGELQREREQERQRRAQVGSLVGGAVLGAAQAGAAVETPAAGGQATVHVDGAAAGAAAGAATVTDAPIVLAPDDLGQGMRQGEARFWLGDAGGSCTMAVAPRDPVDAAVAADIAGTFSLERWYDAKQVEQQRVAIAVTGARGELHARLVARGADPTLQARRREEARLAAEARAEAERAAAAARAEEERRASLEVQAAADVQLQAELERARQVQVTAEAETRVELDARAAWDAHIRGEVLATRERWYAYLVGRCGANPHRRDELRREEERRAAMEAERMRVEVELRMQREAELRVLEARRAQMAIDVRGELRLQMIRRGADPELRARLVADAHRRAEEMNARAAAEYAAYLAIDEHAAAARGQVIDALVAVGARVRPPMPPPVEEYAGVAPSSDAEWQAGHWTWNGAQWMWIEGRWIGGGIDLDIGSGGIGVGVGGVGVGVGRGGVSVEVGAGGGSDPHGGGGGADWSGGREPVRDHRTPAPTPTPAPAPSPSRDREQVRDHRTPAPAPAPASGSGRPQTRDHRDDDDDKKKPARARTRDHR